MQKKTFVLCSSLRIPDPYLFLKSPRSISPPRGPWTSYQPAQKLALLVIPITKSGEQWQHGAGAASGSEEILHIQGKE